jgi:hypothetical protein
MGSRHIAVTRLRHKTLVFLRSGSRPCFSCIHGSSHAYPRAVLSCSTRQVSAAPYATQPRRHKAWAGLKSSMPARTGSVRRCQPRPKLFPARQPAGHTRPLRPDRWSKKSQVRQPIFPLYPYNPAPIIRTSPDRALPYADAPPSATPQRVAHFALPPRRMPFPIVKCLAMMQWLHCAGEKADPCRRVLRFTAPKERDKNGLKTSKECGENERSGGSNLSFLLQPRVSRRLLIGLCVSTSQRTSIECWFAEK